jgi:hypothetical protein
VAFDGHTDPPCRFLPTDTLRVCALAVGLGLLYFGSSFKRTATLVAFGCVMFLTSFINLYAVQVFHSETHGPCHEWPLWTAFIIALVPVLVLSLAHSMLAAAQLTPLIDFATGFAVCAHGCLVVHVALEQFTAYEMLEREQRFPLHLFLISSILLAIIAGLIAAYAAPAMSIVLTCASGGYALAIGLSGLVALATTEPLPGYARAAPPPPRAAPPPPHVPTATVARARTSSLGKPPLLTRAANWTRVCAVYGSTPCLWSLGQPAPPGSCGRSGRAEARRKRS